MIFAGLSHVTGGPSDLGGFDSPERLSSFRVGVTGRGALSGQV